MIDLAGEREIEFEGEVLIRFDLFDLGLSLKNIERQSA